MPKPDPSAKGPALTAQEATAKIAGLITESSPDDRPDAPDVEPAAPPAAPAPAPPAPSEPAATEPEPTEEPVVEDHEVTVDGETLRVDLTELKAGYQKHEDYKRKTMALAEERKTFERESETVQAERAEYAQSLRQLRQALEQLQGEPDWAERRKVLSAEDFLKEKADWEASKAQTDKIRAEEQRVLQQQQDTEAKKYAAYVRAEQDKLKSLIPEWGDPEKFKAEATRLRAHAKTYGFTDQEIDGVTDSRTMLLLRDALKYKDLQREPSDKAKTKAASIRTAKPGAAPPPPAPNQQQRQLIDRALQSHRQRDAVKAVESLLPD